LEGVSNTALQPYFKKSGAPALEENLDDARSTDFTCKSWITIEKETIPDYHVQDIAAGIQRARFPLGPDKGGFTYALEYALDHPEECLGLKASQLEQFIITKGFDVHYPDAILEREDLDRTTWQRWRVPLKKYRSHANGVSAMPVSA
jgi:hypothetical protein